MKTKIRSFFPAIAASAAAVGATFGMTAARAAPVVLDSLTDSVDFSTTTTAILLVAAALIVVYIAMKAAKMVMLMVRSG
jgi:hypothetical protein